MAALQPLAEGHPQLSPSAKKSFSQLFSEPTPSPISIKSPALHRGEPAVIFSRDDVSKLAAPFKLALVGKFSHGRPKLEEIRKFFRALDLKDSVEVGHMDARHVLLRFRSEADFHRIWTRGLWQIGKFPMRTFRWTPGFHVQKESSLVPVWILLPTLPIHFFDKHSLFSIVNSIGRPMFLDAATASLTRPSVARVCVEIDLLKDIPNRVWIGVEGDQNSFWQSIIPENLPRYCTLCFHLGHAADDCRKENLIEEHRPTKEVANRDGIGASADTKNIEKGKKPAVKQVYMPVNKTTNEETQEGMVLQLQSDGINHNDDEAGQIKVATSDNQIEPQTDASHLHDGEKSHGQNDEAVGPTVGSSSLQTTSFDSDNKLCTPGQEDQLARDKGNEVGTRDDEPEMQPIFVEPIDDNAWQVGINNEAVEPMDDLLHELRGNQVDSVMRMAPLPISMAAQFDSSDVEGPRVSDDSFVQTPVMHVQESHSGNFEVGQPSKTTEPYKQINEDGDNAGLLETPQQQTKPSGQSMLTVVDHATREQAKNSEGYRAPPKPHFKDVFEEITWEKLHNKITYIQPQQSKLFLRHNYSSVSETTNDDKNEEEEHSQSDRDQDVDDDQFIQVISKKAKKRKQYSKNGKTMQTRQDLKSKNQASFRYHKCGAC